MADFDLEATLAAAKEAGITLVTQETLDETVNKRLGQIKTKHEGAIGDMQEQFDALKASNAEQAAQLAEYSDKGKSADQKAAEEAAKRDRQLKSTQDLLTEATARGDKLAAQIHNNKIDAALQGVLGAKAGNIQRATMVARAEFRGLDVDANGALTYTDPVSELPYEGDEAKAKFSEWWDLQTDMHRAPSGGPPPSNPKPGNPGGTPYADLTDEQRFARRHAQG